MYNKSDFYLVQKIAKIEHAQLPNSCHIHCHGREELAQAPAAFQTRRFCLIHLYCGFPGRNSVPQPNLVLSQDVDFETSFFQDAAHALCKPTHQH
jgi:hypothetical protein